MVDALKRVTEKLRSENERLRRAAGDGGARAEAERGAREAKKRAAALRGEVERLDAKAKEADGAVLKLAQKQVRGSRCGGLGAGQWGWSWGVFLWLGVENLVFVVDVVAFAFAFVVVAVAVVVLGVIGGSGVVG